jgi:dTDP-4-amino-4,6-dideoxygalactose transaminase
MSYQRAAGHATAYDVVDLGYNYRMDDLRASLGISQLQKLKADLVKRAQVRVLYLDAFKKLDKVIVPFTENNEFVSNYIMPIVLKDSTVDNRDRVREALHAKGIQTSVHYPAVHQFSIYKKYSANLPKTDYATDNEITLPMYSKLTKNDINFIVENLSEVL